MAKALTATTITICIVLLFSMLCFNSKEPKAKEISPVIKSEIKEKAPAPDKVILKGPALLNEVRDIQQNTSISKSGIIKSLVRTKKIISKTIHVVSSNSLHTKTTKISIDNSETHTIEQKFPNTESPTFSVTVKDSDDNSNLLDLKLRTEDFTMDFLYWDYVKELDQEVIQLVTCRTFLLQNIDTQELVKVYIASNSSRFIKAEWYTSSYNENNKLRTLMVKNFQKQNNNQYIASKFRVYGDDWKTEVTFNIDKAK